MKTEEIVLVIALVGILALIVTHEPATAAPAQDSTFVPFYLNYNTTPPSTRSQNMNMEAIPSNDVTVNTPAQNGTQSQLGSIWGSQF